MVKNEIRLLQGDIKNFMEERHSFFLQIRERNKHVENLKSDNDSLLKMNAYYDKKNSGKISLHKGEIGQLEEILRGQLNQQKPRYRGSMVVREILPNDTYRTSQLPSNGRLYATTAHVRQFKASRSWNEDDDDSSENSDDEPEMERPKRTVRKPVRSGSFM
ncbi:hypothetical protein AVEN_253404-1 [Araneus ventricosus]|uniref:Uncharacterized protein n=1 Tax=Araneus ventricosus TaxID=182803 RepID=A0A4Y2WGK9_ARAVE|nr:hypothetical protein AVEN_253404-1 [Araneus ventricosus]